MTKKEPQPVNKIIFGIKEPGRNICKPLYVKGKNTEEKKTKKIRLPEAVLESNDSDLNMKIHNKFKCFPKKMVARLVM